MKLYVEIKTLTKNSVFSSITKKYKLGTFLWIVFVQSMETM